MAWSAPRPLSEGPARGGELTLGYQSMQVAGTPGHRLVTYCAEPGTPDHDAMILLDLLGQQRPPKRTHAHAGPSAAVADKPASPPS
ncbi:MmyB family transcriptional regulator [Streptomyces sp. 2A115]|uniref:MmyB family transcriptional regulator n=1 Tax=Streptomyces sp. 2A115 TaxID=3457439 RepID=UPI003FD5E8F4